MNGAAFVEEAGSDIVSLNCNLEVETISVAITGSALDDAPTDETDVKWSKILDDS